MIARLPIAALLVACTATPPTRPDPTPLHTPGVALDTVPLTEVELPADSRGDVAPPDRVPVGPWTTRPSTGFSVWTAPLPVRPRALFFIGPPPDMTLADGSGKPVPHASLGMSRRAWSLDATTVTYTEVGADRPPPLGATLADVRAQAREASLNLKWSGITDPQAFVQRRLQVGQQTRSGLFLPAPATAAMDLVVPPAAELSFTPGLVPPEVRDLGASDGATLHVEVEVDGRVSPLWRGQLSEGVFTPQRLDLSAWSGRPVRLRFRTEPGTSARLDYVLVGDPLVAPRRSSPRRAVLVFIDTLRQDHLGTYGYARDTSPTLDRWAAAGTAFDQARTLAPWTLPSTRSALTGRLPRAFDAGPTLGEHLRAQGFATAMLAGNVYLSSRFDIDRGFGLHQVVNWPSATEQVQAANHWLDAHRDQDVLLVLHLMDPHLPYQEPESHRSLFAGPTPAGWTDRFARPSVLRRSPGEAIRTWITDRYDNNVRFVDDALADLERHLRDDDLVIVFSDHGEELWDHGGFEHGHSLHEELMRVPLIIRGAGPAGVRSDASVSLLDVTPTVLDWAGLTPGEGLGRSLMPLVSGATDWPERNLPLGHPLYGYERWGVLRGSQKYVTTQGWEGLYDLSQDPSGNQDLWVDGAPEAVVGWREQLASAHRAPVQPALRVALSTANARDSRERVQVRVRSATGPGTVWIGEDAVGTPPMLVEVDGGTVMATWPADWRGARELYMVPVGGLDTSTLEVAFREADRPWIPVQLPPERRKADGDGRPLVAFDLTSGARLTLSFGVSPQPTQGQRDVQGYDPELGSMLQAAGYTVGPE